MDINPATLLTQQIQVPIDPASPCSVTMDEITVTVPVVIVWILPKGYQFSAAGVSGLAGPDFSEGQFDGLSRRRYRWTARRPGSAAARLYSLNIEWIDAQGVLQSCVVPNLKIINRS